MQLFFTIILYPQTLAVHKGADVEDISFDNDQFFAWSVLGIVYELATNNDKSLKGVEGSLQFPYKTMLRWHYINYTCSLVNSLSLGDECRCNSRFKNALCGGVMNLDVTADSMMSKIDNEVIKGLLSCVGWDEGGKVIEPLQSIYMKQSNHFLTKTELN